MTAERDFQVLLRAVPKRLCVGGRWTDGRADAFTVEDPATGSALCDVSNATEVDAREALEAASSAQEEWARTPARTRSEILRRAFEALRAREREIALLIALESGKPLADAHAELDYGADFLRWYAEEAVRPAGDYRDAPAGDKRILASAQPVGPCLLIHPVELPAGDGDAEGRAGARRWDAP